MAKEIRIGFRALDAARFLAAAIAFLLAPLPAMGQQTAAGQASQDSIASFVSRLKAQTIGRQIELTWKDSPDIVGIYRVYRFTEELTSKNFSNAAMIGQVSAGVEYFFDTPPDTSGYYYAVLVQDMAGTLYPLLIPFRNKTSAPAAVASIASPEELAAQVTGITAAANATGDGVEISFVTSNPTRDLLLFWSMRPLAGTADLPGSTSTIRLDPGTTRYVVPALPGVDYWFAVLDAGLYRLGTAQLKKGANATASPVQIPVASAQVSLPLPAVDHRGTPLPSIALDYGAGQALGGSSFFPEVAPEKEVSPATERAISHLLLETSRPTSARLTAQVLSADAAPAPGTQLGELLDIIQGPFKRGDIDNAQKLFLSFLSAPRETEVQAHVRFYLGQTYYLQGKAREALLEFLKSENYFYQYAQPWLDACYADLEKADQ